MLTITSIMGLHLRYRLWIAELNHDINVLRIFDDYLQEIKRKEMNSSMQDEVENFKKKFADSRKEIDDLRHIMHLHKMKLAAESREGVQISEKELESDHHIELEKQYEEFRKSFDQLKNEFVSFEGKYLQ